MDKVLVLDFGGQYDQLIARRVRELGVYSEIKAYNCINPGEIAASGYKAVIFTGGPNSVYLETSPHYDPSLLETGIPVLDLSDDHKFTSRSERISASRINLPFSACRK